MPRKVVAEVLWAAIDFPSPQGLESVVIESKNPSRPIATRRSQRAEINSIRPAVNRMRTAIAGPLGQDLRLNHLGNRWLFRIRLGVEHVNARGAQPRNNQIAPLDMRVGSIRTQCRTASIPAKVMQFISSVWHVHAAHDLAVLF